MTLDLIVLALVIAGGVFGARAGAAAQLANWGALVAGALLARPGGHIFGSAFAGALHTSESLGEVAAGFTTFVVVAVLVRTVGSTVLRGVLGARDEQDRGTDKALGFALGAAKIMAVVWVALSALSFVEENVRLSGKGLGLSPQDSIAFGIARKWNLFAAPGFSPARDLMKAQEAFRSPEVFQRVAGDPAVAALQKNAHFRAVFSDPEVKKALDKGDAVALLKFSSVHKLLQDPDALTQLAALRSALERSDKPVQK
jgi:membrane protein required for colicin V production